MTRRNLALVVCSALGFSLAAPPIVAGDASSSSGLPVVTAGHELPSGTALAPEAQPGLHLLHAGEAQSSETRSSAPLATSLPILNSSATNDRSSSHAKVKVVSAGAPRTKAASTLLPARADLPTVSAGAEIPGGHAIGGDIVR